MRRHLILLIIPLIYCCFLVKNQYSEDKTRSNITFIVGEDMEGDNHYYAAAKKYYCTHDADNKSIVVDTCRSLLSILQVLQDHATKDNKPWGRINIIAHGNEWTGLKLPLLPNAKERLNEKTLKIALYNTLLPNLNNCKKLDARTQMHIKGCAVGKDEALLTLMKQAFGGRLQVYSPEKFVVYQPDNRCYLADYFYSFHHPDSSFDAHNAVQQFQEHYSRERIDWAAVLGDNNPQNAKSPFVYRFKIPIRWTVNFPDSTQVPQFPNAQNLQFEDWLFQQKQLMATLEKIDLPKESFRWVFDVQGNSMKILGVCQVVSVLKPEELVYF